MEIEPKESIKENTSEKKQRPFFHFDLTEEVKSVDDEEEVMKLLDEITKTDEY